MPDPFLKPSEDRVSVDTQGDAHVLGNQYFDPICTKDLDVAEEMTGMNRLGL